MLIGFQELFGCLDSTSHKILMGRHSINLFEKSDEVILRKRRLTGYICEIDLVRIVCINKQFGLNDPAINVASGVTDTFHTILSRRQESFEI